MSRPIVLPADVYHTLEFSALAFGGIGQGSLQDRDGAPLCAAGHASAATLSPEAGWSFGPCWKALSDAIGPERCIGDWNDAAFNEGEGRISFAEWCRRLDVVRGT